MTVNWRDIRGTIQKTTLSVKKDSTNIPAASEDSDLEGKSSEMNTHDDPVEDPLKWLDEGLPDYFGYNRNEFDLALQFDIQRYIDILADSVSDPQKTSDSLSRLGRETSHSKLKGTAANTLAPTDEEWGKWD